MDKLESAHAVERRRRKHRLESAHDEMPHARARVLFPTVLGKVETCDMSKTMCIRERTRNRQRERKKRERKERERKERGGGELENFEGEK